MEFPDRFPDRGELILIALLEADGQLNTRELRQSIQALNRDQINYRVGRLSELSLVETERQGEDDRGQPRPKLVRLTNAGHDLATEASEHLRYQIDISDGAVGITDDELQALTDAIDTLNEQVADLNQRLTALETRVETLETDVSELDTKVYNNRESITSIWAWAEMVENIGGHTYPDWLMEERVELRTHPDMLEAEDGEKPDL